MIVTVKHNLEKNIAKQRIQILLKDTVKKHATLISTHEFSWLNDVCDVNFSAQKMNIHGSLTVKESEVQVKVGIPFIFLAFRGKVKEIIEVELAKVLNS